MQQIKPGTLNLLILIGIGFLAQFALKKYEMDDYLYLHYIDSNRFYPWQVITHMFSHDPDSIFHILFNSYGLWMFGNIIEHTLGTKKFLVIFFVSGISAAILSTIKIGYLDVYKYVKDFFPIHNNNQLAQIILVKTNSSGNTITFADYVNFKMQSLGASGAVYGLVAGFAFCFPNRELVFLFIPYPIKAKYLISGLVIIETIFIFTGSPMGNINHAAHVGGAIAGFLLMKYYVRKKIDTGWQ